MVDYLKVYNFKYDGCVLLGVWAATGMNTGICIVSSNKHKIYCWCFHFLFITKLG